MPAYYRSSLGLFSTDDVDRIVGVLATESAKSGFADLKLQQTTAWEKEISALKSACESLIRQVPRSSHWGLLLEYPIPRRQKRVDVILLAHDLIFCLEFKTEDKFHRRQTQQQVEDYALDLRDFHEESRGRRIIPIAVTLKGEIVERTDQVAADDFVRAVVVATELDLAAHIAEIFNAESNAESMAIDFTRWDYSAYRPVPTIIEAAEALYAGHDVREIAHSHAGEVNLTVTARKLVEIIQRAQRDHLKVACFVTGVPGAGKTLAGLNVVHNPALRQEGRPPGIFLSGNGPLVKILSAAITRDFSRRTQAGGADRTVGTFIQNVHAFARDALDKPDKPPAENIIIFDEAQRAWNTAQNKRKTGSELSEPETILSIMDRHKDWAVVVALVGGGQEIHSGEAGLAEWGRALRASFPHWRVAVSPKALTGDTSVAGQRLFADSNIEAIMTQEPALHLEVNIRSFRARRIAEWVNAVLAGDAHTATRIAAELTDFPLVLTRSLIFAKDWLRKHARGLRRCGLVASSGAIRLRADGIELSTGFRQGNRDLYVNWFLNDPADVRSSNQLEVAASEFECQGLELDWIGLCWGGDLTFDLASGKWILRSFSGNRWKDVVSEIDREFLLNKYRVLLTRAREGMVIWIPKGDATDSTRTPEWFDQTAAFLEACGLTVQ